MTALDRLRAARQAKDEGRHEDALRDLVWFHHHALEEERSLVGVRLSYALSDWIDLGNVYPQALQALKDLREQKAQALLRGEGDRGLFHDVVAIDERLGRGAATYPLYLALAEQYPALAAQCAPLALSAIVAAKDYRLADQLRPDPETRIRPRALVLAKELRWERQVCRFTKAPRRWATIKSYADDVRLLLEIANGLGRHEQARRLQALAIDLIADPTLREAVRAEFSKPSSGWTGVAALYHRHGKAARREARRRTA